MKESSVSIIIPAWNEVEAIISTLKALKCELDNDSETQVIIAAGGEDNTFEVVSDWLRKSKLSWQVLKRKPNSRSAAINQALQIVEQGIVVFLDADTQVRLGWLEALIEPIKKAQAEATSGKFLPYRQTAVTAVFELDQLVSQEIHQANNLFAGASIALSFEALNAIGGKLPEDAVAADDWDLSQLILKKGLQRKYVKEAVVYTERPQTWLDYWKNEVRWRRGLLDWRIKYSTKYNCYRCWFELFYQQIIHTLFLLGWLLLLIVAWLFKIPVWNALVIWLAFVGLVLMRHLWRCIEAYRYTRNLRWLRTIPVYSLVLFVIAASTWQAIFTFHKLNPYYKGRRSKSQTYFRHNE